EGLARDAFGYTGISELILVVIITDWEKDACAPLGRPVSKAAGKGRGISCRNGFGAPFYIGIIDVRGSASFRPIVSCAGWFAPSPPPFRRRVNIAGRSCHRARRGPVCGRLRHFWASP